MGTVDVDDAVTQALVVLPIMFGPVFWCGAAVALGLAVVLVPQIARRFEVSRRRAGLTFSWIWVVVLVTSPFVSLSDVVRAPALWSTRRALTWIGDDWSQVSLWRFDDQGWGNIALYLPAGYVLASVTRRPWLSWLGLLGLSLVIETVQAGLGTRIADVGDVYANSLGALIGAAAWFAVRRGSLGNSEHPGGYS